MLCFTLQSPILFWFSFEVQPKIAAICQDADNWQQLDSPFESISQNLQLWQMLKNISIWSFKWSQCFSIASGCFFPTDLETLWRTSLPGGHVNQLRALRWEKKCCRRTLLSAESKRCYSALADHVHSLARTSYLEARREARAFELQSWDPREWKIHGSSTQVRSHESWVIRHIIYYPNTLASFQEVTYVYAYVFYKHIYVKVYLRRGIYECKQNCVVCIFMWICIYIYIYAYMYTYTGRQTHLHTHTHTHTHDVTLPRKATFMKLPDDSPESGTHFLCFLSSNDFPPV